MKTVKQWFDLLTPEEQDLYVKRLQQRFYGKWFIDAWDTTKIPLSFFLAFIDSTDSAFEDYRNRALNAISHADFQ